MRSSGAQATEPRLVSTTVAIDDFELAAAAAVPHSFAWMRNGEGFVGYGRAARIDVAASGDRCDRASLSLGRLLDSADVNDDVGAPGTGPIAAGALTFDTGAPGSCLVVPEVVLGRRGGRAWRTHNAFGTAATPLPLSPIESLRVPLGASSPEAPALGGSSMTEAQWLAAVAIAVAAVEAGDLDKVVLARDIVMTNPEPFDAGVVVHRLASAYPGCFTFSCDGFVGASPELLVRRSGERVESLPLAGSAPRGTNASEDAALGKGLERSLKDRREHDLTVQMIREALEGVCNTVHVEPGPFLMRFANIWHLATRVTGRLGTPLSALELAGRLHPSAAICGVPTDAALTFIRRYEGLDRGRYGGPVGWVDARGDGEWAIALRCAEIEGNRARLFAGGGIVAASEPQAELDETKFKLRAMSSALAG